MQQGILSREFWFRFLSAYFQKLKRHCVVKCIKITSVIISIWFHSRVTSPFLSPPEFPVRIFSLNPWSRSLLWKYLQITHLLQYKYSTAYRSEERAGTGGCLCSVSAVPDGSSLTCQAFCLPHAALLLGESRTCSLVRSVQTRMEMMQAHFYISLPVLPFTLCF